MDMAAENVKAGGARSGGMASNMDSDKHQMAPSSFPGSAAGWVGTTTRSGRRSIPVLKFQQHGGREMDQTSTVLTESNLEQRCVASAKCMSRASSKKYTAQTFENCPRTERTDLVAADARLRGLAVDDVSQRSEVAESSQDREAAACALVDVRRGAAPALQWWRNQSSTNAEDRRVMKAAQIPELKQGPLARGNPTDISADGSCPSSTEQKTVCHESGSEQAQWTESQLHSLRVAQADTDPSTSDFWGTVADKVSDRDPQQCQHKWFEYIAKPRDRPRKGPNRSSISLNPRMPLSAPPSDEQGDVTDIDDLFQATPTRQGRGLCSESDGARLKTPKTPAGPGPSHENRSVAKCASEGECAGYKRSVSRTYVKTMSKKIRKGSSQSVRSNVAAGREHSTKRPCGVVGRCRTIHAADVSRGRRLNASVSSTGTVTVASVCSSDEDSFGLPGDEESDDG